MSVFSLKFKYILFIRGVTRWLSFHKYFEIHTVRPRSRSIINRGLSNDFGVWPLHGARIVEGRSIFFVMINCRRSHYAATLVSFLYSRLHRRYLPCTGLVCKSFATNKADVTFCSALCKTYVIYLTNNLTNIVTYSL